MAAGHERPVQICGVGEYQFAFRALSASEQIIVSWRMLASHGSIRMTHSGRQHFKWAEVNLVVVAEPITIPSISIHHSRKKSIVRVLLLKL